MSIHGDDVVIAIRKGLLKTSTCSAMTDVRLTPDQHETWPRRDGMLEFDAIGSDLGRAFRITVEVIDIGIVFGDLEEANADGSFKVIGARP